MDTMTGIRGSGGGALTLPEASEQLRHLGFLLISPFLERSGEANLLVALRERPTQEHFDPEVVRFWRTGEDHRGHADELTIASPMPYQHAFTWGKLELTDRFGIENDFVSLGGTVTADRTPQGVIAIFHSPGPILRMGGHSQAVDRVALEMGAFFGRIMVPIDFQPGAEEEISSASPLERYAAFVAFEHDRYAAFEALRDEHPRQAEILREEAQRLRREHPDDWLAGERLLDRIGLRV